MRLASVVLTRCDAQVAAEYGLTLAQKAALLAAFFPAFIPSQLLASFLIQRYGAKVVTTAQNAGLALSLLACPAAMAAAGHLGLAACFVSLGVFQSPLFPALSVLKRSWTAGAAPAHRAMWLRVMSAGQYVANFLAALVTPLLARRFGWQAVPYTFGGVMAALTVVWHCCASEAPEADDDAVQPQPKSGGQTPRGGPQAAGMGVSWAIFRVRGVQACLLSHISHNTMLYTLMQWAPTYYIECFGIPRAAIGRWLAVPATVNIWGGFLIGALEARCLQTGMPQLRVRRLFTAIGTGASAACLLLFTLAPTAVAAVVAQCGVVLSGCYSGSGFSSNYYEVGGRNTAMLSGVGNVFASVPGLVLPAIGVALKRRFDSWAPIFVLASAVMLASGQVYWRHCSLEPAEETLALLDQAASAAEGTSVPKQSSATNHKAGPKSQKTSGGSSGSEHSSSMSWCCTASDEGARLERLLRDKCRDLDPARRLSNRLIKDAITNGEATINGERVADKSRVLHEGDVVALSYDTTRAASAQAASNRALLHLEHDSDDLAVVWKPAGVNRDLEEAIDQEISAAPGLGGNVSKGKPQLVYRLAKGVAGLLVVAKTQQGLDLVHSTLGAAASVESAACCFRVLVYGKLDTGGKRLTSSELRQLKQLHQGQPPGCPGSADGDNGAAAGAIEGDALGLAMQEHEADDDDDDEEEDASADKTADGNPASSGAMGVEERRAAAVALNRADDRKMASAVSICTVEVTRSQSSGHMSRVDVWCNGWSSGGKHKRALCRHLAELGHPVVGDERANHAWVKKKGLHLALLSLTLPSLDGGSGTTVCKPEPTKFGHTAKRELKFFEQAQRQQATLSEPQPDPQLQQPSAADGGAPSLSPSSLPAEHAVFKSSSLGLSNRVRDLELVMRSLRVPEEGSSTVQLWERDRAADMAALNLTWEREPNVERKQQVAGANEQPKAARERHPLLLAVGYRRILLGDHGPYFELERSQVVLENFAAETPKQLVHYVERYSHEGAKLYEQTRTVADRPNPPKEGRYWHANNRAEGYADYVVGRYYLSCDQVRVTEGPALGPGGTAREILLDHEQLKDLHRDALQRRLLQASTNSTDN